MKLNERKIKRIVGKEEPMRRSREGKKKITLKEPNKDEKERIMRERRELVREMCRQVSLPQDFSCVV